MRKFSFPVPYRDKNPAFGVTNKEDPAAELARRQYAEKLNSLMPGWPSSD